MTILQTITFYALMGLVAVVIYKLNCIRAECKNRRLTKDKEQ